MKSLLQNGGTKASLVREFYQRYGDLSPQLIQEKIKEEKGIDVANGQIYGIRSALEKAGALKNPHSIPPVIPTALANLQKLADIANEIGSVEDAINLLQTLKTLQLVSK
jgi:hypothetical protein